MKVNPFPPALHGKPIVTLVARLPREGVQFVIDDGDAQHPLLEMTPEEAIHLGEMLAACGRLSEEAVARLAKQAGTTIACGPSTSAPSGSKPS